MTTSSPHYIAQFHDCLSTEGFVVTVGSGLLFLHCLADHGVEVGSGNLDSNISFPEGAGQVVMLSQPRMVNMKEDEVEVELNMDSGTTANASFGTKTRLGDGGAHSLGNGGALSGTYAAQSSNIVDDVGKDNDDLNSSPTKDTPGISVLNKEDNLHDENDGLKPSKSTAKLNKGTSYANLFTGGHSRKAMNFHTLFTPAGNGVDVVIPVNSIRAISE
ncbi:hypothetical protein Tco_0568909 [Tanacetum coccineum]